MLSDIIRKRGPIKKIGVLGMGYVGIPAAALFADAPQFENVYGFQRDSASSGYKIAMLNRGESPLKGEEPGLEELIKRNLERVVIPGFEPSAHAAPRPVQPPRGPRKPQTPGKVPNRNSPQKPGGPQLHRSGGRHR